MFTVGGPLNTNGTVKASLTNLFETFKRPDVDLTLQVAEASNEAELREGADPNGVPVAFAEFK